MQSKAQLEAITNLQQTQHHMMEKLSMKEMPPVKKADQKAEKRRFKDLEEEDGEDDEEALQPTKEKRRPIQSDGRPSPHMQMYRQPQQVQYQSFQPQFQWMQQPQCQCQPAYQHQCPQLQFSQQSYPLQFGQHHCGAWR